jgi:hypothetical protein
VRVTMSIIAMGPFEYRVQYYTGREISALRNGDEYSRSRAPKRYRVGTPLA